MFAMVEWRQFSAQNHHLPKMDLHGTSTTAHLYVMSDAKAMNRIRRKYFDAEHVQPTLDLLKVNCFGITNTALDWQAMAGMLGAVA